MIDRHRTGAAAILAMMFLVIFGSLAAAMAIVSQGNLASADAQLKIDRARAAAETGLEFVRDRIDEEAATVTTREGVISDTVAVALWQELRDKLEARFANDVHSPEPPDVRVDSDTGGLHVGAIAVGPGNAPSFTTSLTPHPLPGENYDSNYYDRPPYDTINGGAVSEANPLDARWLRLKVVAHDGPAKHRVTRSIKLDLKITKKIPYAILSKSRVMLGRNVIVRGPVGSSFQDTHLPDGHPVQMQSDFSKLNDDLDNDLAALTGTLIEYDINNDNRISLSSDSEKEGLPDTADTDPSDLDLNNDGYVDDYDFFLKHFDTDANGEVTRTEIENNANDDISGRQLLELIDESGYGPGDPPPSWDGDPSNYPGREGYDDGVIDDKDRYAKVRGEVHISSSVEKWEEGAAKPDGEESGEYRDYFAGAIHPDYDRSPMNFGSGGQNSIYEFEPSDFDVTQFRQDTSATDNQLMAQAQEEAAKYDPDDPESPQPLGQEVTEAVPFQAAHPYDYYDRPVFENMTFENVRIPKGTNALFRDCTFKGTTFIETTSDNTHENFNYSGMRESDGDLKHPDRTVPDSEGPEDSTKDDANNIRFEGCDFHGAVVTDVPQSFTHVRNKLSFTGKTEFIIDDSPYLSETEKQLYSRSTILAPHFSVEMGTFVAPYDNDETVTLSGTIVTGIIDMRGQVTVNGTILTTYRPEEGEPPVVGETSPQFNTTIGYFGSDQGDLEAEVPERGLGQIELRYDPRLPLPDGVLGPIQVEPAARSYTEGGA